MQEESTLRRHGFWVLVPRTQQVVLGAFILILAAAGTLPFPFLDYAIAINSLWLVGQFSLGALILVPLLGGMNAHVPDSDKIRTLPGWDVATGGVAIAAALLTAVAVINVGYMFTGCGSTYAIQTLPQFILNVSLETLNASITSPLIRRRLYLFTDLSWYQGCVDDLPVAIFLLIDYGVLIVLDIVATILHFNLRRRTKRWAIEMNLMDRSDEEG